MDQKNLEEIVVLPDIADYVEGTALGHSIKRLWKMNKAARVLWEAHEQTYKDKNYKESIPFETLKTDFLNIIDPSEEYNDLDYDILKRGFALGILTRTSWDYYNMEVQPDLSSNGDKVKLGMKSMKLAQSYVNKIVKTYEPVEEGDNGAKILNDITFLYSRHEDLLQEYTSKKTKKIQPQTTDAFKQTEKGIGQKHTANKSLFDKVSNYYQKQDTLGKNITAFGYGLFISTLSGLGGPETAAIPQDVALWNTAFFTCWVNAFFPVVFKGTTFENTLSHTPGLYAGLYSGLYLLDKIA